MNLQFKRLILLTASGVSWIWRFVPSRCRKYLLTGLFVIESRGDARLGLTRLLQIQDSLDWVTNERAVAYGQGTHPKHRLICYHEFFIKNIPRGARVLDIGCGIGAVARAIASRVDDSEVVGVDRDLLRLEKARAGNNPKNLRFVQADVCDSLPEGPWQAVVLSNVLEHIENRVEFLQEVLKSAKPERVLIRVPHFERDWKMPMRKELGINYFSDEEHFIEHRLDQLQAELSESGLRPIITQTFWGEIWTCCECVKRNKT